MAAVVTFDPINLRILEINTGLAVNTLSIQEIYSEWKDWLLADSSRKGYPQAFRVVGGDPISDIQNLGSTFFILFPWKIRAAEYNHNLVLEGNVFTDPAGASPVVGTLGAYQINYTFKVSNLIDASVARLDLLALTENVYIDTDNGVAGTDGDIGTPTNPVNNLADATTIANANNLKAFKLRGEITLLQSYDDWTFEAIAAEDSAKINLNGQSVNDSHFVRTHVSGAGIGEVDGLRCDLNGISGISGTFHDCGFYNTIELAAGEPTTFHGCYSEVPGSGRPLITFTAGATANFRNYSGGIEVFGMVAGNIASIDMNPATTFIGPTNTGGELLVRGTGLVFDTSAGTTLIDQSIQSQATSIIKRIEDWGAINFSKG